MSQVTDKLSTQTDRSWLAAAANLASELQQQPAAVKQAMKDLSKRQYR